MVLKKCSRCGLLSRVEDGSDDGDCSCWENEELGVGVGGGLGPIDNVRWKANTRPQKGVRKRFRLGRPPFKGWSLLTSTRISKLR